MNPRLRHNISYAFDLIHSALTPFFLQQNIQAFYPPGSLDIIAAQVASSGALDKIANEWRMPKEIATDLVKISLFDVVLYVDDSGSMAFEEGEQPRLAP